jgi:hypothetical protein
MTIFWNYWRKWAFKKTKVHHTIGNFYAPTKVIKQMFLTKFFKQKQASQNFSSSSVINNFLPFILKTTSESCIELFLREKFIFWRQFDWQSFFTFYMSLGKMPWQLKHLPGIWTWKFNRINNKCQILMNILVLSDLWYISGLICMILYSDVTVKYNYYTMYFTWCVNKFIKSITILLIIHSTKL